MIRDFTITRRMVLKQYEHVEVTASAVVATSARGSMGEAIDEIEGILNEKYRGGTPKVVAPISTPAKPIVKADPKPEVVAEAPTKEAPVKEDATLAVVPDVEVKPLTLEDCTTIAKCKQFAVENEIDLTGAKNKAQMLVLCGGGTLEAAPGKEVVTKAIRYDRENDQHRAKFSKQLTETLNEKKPEWKKDPNIKEAAGKLSEQLNGEDFIGEDGEILTSFVNEIIGALIG